MSDTCQVKITSSFKAGLWEWCDMLAGFGYIYRKTAVFVDGSELPINITADGFSAKIYNSLGVLVDTLLLGTDLVVVGTNKLNILLGPPVTTLAGTYKGVLVWTRASTGEVIPIFNFIFIIE